MADLAIAAFRQAHRLWTADPTTPYVDLLDRAAEQSDRGLTGS